jgi:concanavalin A-like lectin/glucanase superfamily protein
MSVTWTTAKSQAKSGLSINGDTQFTSAFWANFSSFADAGTDHVLTWSNGTNGDLNSIAHDAGDTHLYCGATKGATLNLTNFATVAVNEWHHYCMTWDGSTITAYTDGVSSTTVACTLTGRVNWTTLTTGRFSGQGENAVIFSRALTASEVFDLFCNRKPRDFTSILVYWPIYDNVSNLVDRSGNGNDATASGGSATAGTDNPRTQLGIGHPKYVPGVIQMTASGGVLVSGTAAMTAAAQLQAAGGIIVNGSAAMSMSAQLAAAGSVACDGVCVMTSDAPATPAPSGGVYDPRRIVKKPWAPMRAP